jgi:hypothetical protein
LGVDLGKEYKPIVFFIVMAYLYHAVPEKMKGRILYPLNALKNKYPKIYSHEIKKYIGRGRVLSIRIPKMDCLWNDVIHLSPIHPRKVKAEIENAGFQIKKSKWYKISVFELDRNSAKIYLYRHDKNIYDEEIIDYEPNEISKYNFVLEGL